MDPEGLGYIRLARKGRWCSESPFILFIIMVFSSGLKKIWGEGGDCALTCSSFFTYSLWRAWNFFWSG